MEKIQEIYDKTRLDMFVMAVSHLMDIGYRQAIEITDDDISKIKMDDNAFMTTEFCKELVMLARDLALASKTPSSLMKFCAEHEIFGDCKRIIVTMDYGGMISNILVTPNMRKADVEIIDWCTDNPEYQAEADEAWKLVNEEFEAGELVAIY